FNPDEAAARLLYTNPTLTQQQANVEAWHIGKTLLERAIDRKLTFAFETTLGGNTITNLLERAADVGIDVRIWYVGLSSPELHVARVCSRVQRGGHDIPEAKIRERYSHSRMNLILLLPKVAELFVYDNSDEADPNDGAMPQPKLILHALRGTI